jgi:AraC-like DNA-binding protein
MLATERTNDAAATTRARNEGLFRTILAGSGRSLPEAFEVLERAPDVMHASNVERICRHPDRDLLGARISLPADEGQGYWDLTRIRDEIYVVVANFAYKDPRVEIVPGDGLIQLCFKISGDMSLAVSSTEPLRWNRPSLLVWSQPTGVDSSAWTAPSARERYITISVRSEFLAKQFLQADVPIPEQLRAFVSKDHAVLNYVQRSLSAQTFDAATRLIDNPFSGSLGLVYTEALALELLCCAVGSFSSLSGAPSETYTDRELKCLHAARAMLMKQFAPAPTITKLARAVGMAKSTLTKGFKAVHGETIADFSLRCRMRHALALMRDQNWSVAKVSEAVGYSHATSFTTAFRRHFGMRPIDVRRVKRTR